jgi:diacylglycerol kinase (ATP)
MVERKDRKAGVNPVLVLLNSNAGQKVRIGDGPPMADRVREVLASRGLTADVEVTQSAEDAVTLAREAVREGRRIVVAAGGDGTIGEVATELLDSRVTLGVLPLGSVMNIPRMLDLPRDLESAADVLARGVTRQIDVGVANGVVFYEAASVGMNAGIFREVQRFSEGDYVSLPRAFWVAFRYRPARMHVELDEGEVETRALMVTISNGPYTGAGLTVAPDAELDDGRLDVRVFRHFSKFELLRHLASIAFGRRRYTPHASTFRSAVVRVESARPLPCRADSNDLGTTPLECRVKRASLRVIVGQSHEDADGARSSRAPPA